MKLYGYQENVLCAIDSDPCHSQLISMPTGTGKTITFLTCAFRKNKKCLILVHRKELLDQTFEKAILVGFTRSEISTITSDDKQEIRKLTIAMVPTLIRNLDRYKSDEIEMVIIDEAHHATANSYGHVLAHFRIMEEQKLLLGFTATPLRGDKKQLGDLFLSHSFKMTLSEATQQGYICPVHGMRVDIDKTLNEIDSVNGDYDISQLDKLMNCEAITDLIASRCQHLSKTPAIIFCTSVNHAKNISEALRKKKRKAISVSYLTSKITLDKIFSMLRQGKIEFITNAVKLSEGFDYPPIQTIILARPTRSPVLYKQMIGRGLRLSPKKYDCFVLEFSGNDEKMICWEDIDENCTFQSSSIGEKLSIKDALSFYKGKFSSPDIRILDVRVSPFKFYECKISRIVRYKKNYRFSIGEEGFTIFEHHPDPIVANQGVLFYTFNVWMCFWKEKYKSFYLWSGGVIIPNENTRLASMEHIDRFINGLRKDNHQERWYPSEEEPMTFQQKKILGTSQKLSARKAEMMIEDMIIKKIIDKYFLVLHPSFLKHLDPSRDDLDGCHHNPVFEI